MTESRKKSTTEKKEATSQEKLGEYPFKGQHMFEGGFSSCTANALEAVAVFSHMPDDEFFRFWPPPSELNKIQKTASCARLDAICLAGNKLSIRGSKTKDMIDKKPDTPASFFSFCKILLGKNPGLFLNKIKCTMTGYENIKDLVILNEELCPKKAVIDYTKNIYEKYRLTGLTPSDIFFMSGAAYHTTTFFTKIRPTDNKAFYYVFDTSPSRATGGDKNIGLLEVHRTLESAIAAILTRWTWRFSADQVGELYAIATNTRIKELQQPMMQRSENHAPHPAHEEESKDPPVVRWHLPKK